MRFVLFGSELQQKKEYQEEDEYQFTEHDEKQEPIVYISPSLALLRGKIKLD